ncbi:MAG: cell filamentation protein Fic, partial [Bacteroidetes bacterium]|nr:cell filamentation protein Fic [Bacteroidota bacterium]
MKNNHFSHKITTFHNRNTTEPGMIVGYGALISAFEIAVPLPERLAIISEKHKRITLDQWEVFTPRHMPEDTLAGHLIFALKYEGVDLYILKEVFKAVEEKEIQELVNAEPTGQYTRRIWFFYEWLMEKQLSITDLKTGNYVDVLDEKLQYPGPSENSPRHR